MLIARREWRLEWRRPQMAAGVLVYALLLVVVFTLAVDPFARDPKPLAASVLWLCYFFAALGGFQRSYARERQEGALAGLAAAPLDPAAVLFGKWLFGTLLVLAAEAVVTPVFLSLAGFTRIASPGGAALALALGTVGLTAVASLVAVLSAGLRAGEALLPVLALPLLAPLAMGGVRLLDAALAPSGALAGPDVWLRVLGAYDIIFLALLALLAPYALEG